MATIFAATTAGLFVLDDRGETLGVELGEISCTDVDVNGQWLAVATADGRVLRRPAAPAVADDAAWQELGSTHDQVWCVRLETDGSVLIGLEPAGIARVDSTGVHLLDSLGSVDGASDWHSPWGPADLSTIAVAGERIAVGIEVGGVAVSEDRGATWQSRSEGLYEDVHAVVMVGDTLFATTGMGAHVSFDAGRVWLSAIAGIDRGYTQGLAVTTGAVVISAASGPPPLWEAGGPEAALFRAVETSDELPVWVIVAEGFDGNVGRHALAAAGRFVVAGTDAGELLVSTDAAQSFEHLGVELPPVNAVAVAADS